MGSGDEVREAAVRLMNEYIRENPKSWRLVDVVANALRRDRAERDTLEADLVRLGEEIHCIAPEKQRWFWDEDRRGLCVYDSRHLEPRTLRAAVEAAVREMEEKYEQNKKNS